MELGHWVDQDIKENGYSGLLLENPEYTNEKMTIGPITVKHVATITWTTKLQPVP